MTELGLAFDDDDFDTQKRKCFEERDLPYHVKILEPRWFELPNDSNNPNPQVLKSRGDLRYRLKDYAGAVQAYKASLDILPKNNVTVSQDMRESLARCYAHLGNRTEGLQISRDLVKEMSAEDEARQRQTLMLHAFVCEKASLWGECVKSLQRLCLLQPSYPHTWYQLGEAIIKLACFSGTEDDLKRLTDDCRQDPDNSVNRIDCNSSDEDREKDKKKLLLMSLMCYERAKLLLESVMRNASDIIKVRNQRLAAEISEKINNLPLSEELKLEMSEVGSVEDSHVDEDNIFETDDISDVFFHRFCKWHKSIMCRSIIQNN